MDKLQCIDSKVRSILPPGVSPSHLPLPLLNQLTAASAAAAATAGTTSQPGLPALPLAPPGAASLLHQPPITTKQSQKQSNAELEKQLRLQQQQLLYLHSVYAQHFQGLFNFQIMQFRKISDFVRIRFRKINDFVYFSLFEPYEIRWLRNFWLILEILYIFV